MSKWFLNSRDSAQLKALHLLDGILVFPDRHTEHKLNRAPQTMELRAFVNIHDAIAGRLALPDRVLHERLDPAQHNLKHRQAAAQPLPGK